MRRRRAGSLFFIALAGAIPLYSQQQPRPADPLTAAEIKRATGVATPMAAERLGARERLELVSVELINVKPAEPAPRQLRAEEVGRHAVVTYFHYDRNEGMSVLVDLREGHVVSSSRLASRAVPLGRPEIQRAAALALENAEVRRLVRADQATYRVQRTPGASGDDVIEGLRVISGRPDDPCSVDRCVDLFFRLNGRYLVRRQITVNLTRQTIVARMVERGAP